MALDIRLNDRQQAFLLTKCKIMEGSLEEVRDVVMRGLRQLPDGPLAGVMPGIQSAEEKLKENPPSGDPEYGDQTQDGATYRREDPEVQTGSDPEESSRTPAGSETSEGNDQASEEAESGKQQRRRQYTNQRAFRPHMIRFFYHRRTQEIDNQELVIHMWQVMKDRLVAADLEKNNVGRIRWEASVMGCKGQLAKEGFLKPGENTRGWTISDRGIEMALLTTIEGEIAESATQDNSSGDNRTDTGDGSPEEESQHPYVHPGDQVMALMEKDSTDDGDDGDDADEGDTMQGDNFLPPEDGPNRADPPPEERWGGEAHDPWITIPETQERRTLYGLRPNDQITPSNEFKTPILEVLIDAEREMGARELVDAVERKMTKFLTKADMAPGSNGTHRWKMNLSNAKQSLLNGGAIEAGDQRGTVRINDRGKSQHRQQMLDGRLELPTETAKA